jgi:large subunit ribosomal protein L21
MYAVVETGGKQYRVAPGDTIHVETLPGEVGQDIELEKVIAIADDEGKLLTGDDVANAKVTATIAKHGRGDKVIVFKFKRKKQYKRTTGHRQNYTRLTVKEIVQ